MEGPLLQGYPTAIVLDGNQRSALATVRSLGRHGVPVVVADAMDEPLACSSRYGNSRLKYPDPAEQPAAFTNWLKDLDERYPGAVLLPMTDLTVPLVLKATPALPNLLTALPSLEMYEALSDKYRLFQIARSAGVPVPGTMLLSRANIGDVAHHDFSYPVVVKPRQSATLIANRVLKRTVRYASDLRQLETIVREELQSEADGVLVQEFVQGAGTGVFAHYVHGESKAFFAHRRIREKPPSGGVSVLCESIALPQASFTYARKLLDAAAWNGVAMVEFKTDAHGNPWLMEINARFWGSLQLAINAGVDFPWALYRSAIGLGGLEQRPYKVGCQLRWWLGDLDNLYARLRSGKWTPTLRAKAAAVGEFLLPWWPGLSYEFLQWSDPKPALAGFRQYIRSINFRGTS